MYVKRKVEVYIKIEQLTIDKAIISRFSLGIVKS